MTEDSPAETAAGGADQAKVQSGSPDPVQRATLVVVTICACLLLWYLLADRYAPWTDQARVQAYVVPIAPKVSGKLVAVQVHQDQLVQQGEVLARIDARDYEAAVQKAEAALEQAGQDVGASTDAVSVAEAKRDEAQAQLTYVIQQADRYLELAGKGVVSKADADRAVAEVEKAKATERSAQADLDKAKEQLGRQGDDNPRVRDAIAALEQARINLAEATLRAPSDGGITNLLVDEGHFANAGAAIMTFVSFNDVWVQADLRENSLGNLQVGDRAEIVLDSAPGQVFTGEVRSIGFAVGQAKGNQVGGLMEIKSGSGWLRDAQRFPVLVRFTGEMPRGVRRLGGQADVQFYTRDGGILNGLGWLWIRLMSLLTYVY